MDNDIIQNNTLFAMVINPNPLLNGYLFTFGSKDDSLSTDGLFTYLSNGLDDQDPDAIRLLRILIPVIESIKFEYPDIAAQVRKMNVDFHKSKNNDTNNG